MMSQYIYLIELMSFVEKTIEICKLQFLIEKHGKKCYNIMQYKCQIVHQNWRIKMAVNYDKLWRILNERGMMKTELIREAKSVQMQWQSLAEMKMYV